MATAAPKDPAESPAGGAGATVAADAPAHVREAASRTELVTISNATTGGEAEVQRRSLKVWESRGWSEKKTDKSEK